MSVASTLLFPSTFFLFQFFFSSFFTCAFLLLPMATSCHFLSFLSLSSFFIPHIHLCSSSTFQYRFTSLLPSSSCHLHPVTTLSFSYSSASLINKSSSILFALPHHFSLPSHLFCCSPTIPQFSFSSLLQTDSYPTLCLRGSAAAWRWICLTSATTEQPRKACL